MRSFTSRQATEMDLFWLALLLAHLLVTESVEKTQPCISQPSTVIWHKTQQTAVLNCSMASHCSASLRYEWFTVKEHSHRRLSITANKDKYRLVGSSLHIRSLNTSDSGIYHCAAAAPEAPKCCTKHVGEGVTLVVRDHVKIMVRHILLWLSFVLLVIYSLAVVTLLILKKYGCKVDVCKKTHKTEKNTSNTVAQFHDVLKEMNSRQNLEKQRASGKQSQDEAAQEFSSSTDDIYQNV
ncbi:immunoglobulin superfamily member 6 [Parambassis ranga]|uniref:immunoglobulin superfamily member 6 n=1 Tax=Parambassis ranga TaxID=210632 RepID=UPI00104205C4|nr:immunoglobulin superfamily member 6-like [Parambassis ranga]